MPAKLSGMAGLENDDRAGGKRVRLNVRLNGCLNGKCAKQLVTYPLLSPFQIKIRFGFY
jgi:hypothetical protein